MQDSSAREEFYARASDVGLTPLWQVLDHLVTPTPMPRAVPVMWRYEAVRPYILEAGRLISAQEAVRRVLVLENPSYRGESRITNTLYAGLQLILPGEIAPAHRHTQSALRFILEGKGAYTAVHGERTTMLPGDLILTPAWAFHDHGNDTNEPMIWLDGLDIPLVQYLDASFAESAGVAAQQLTRPEGDAPARFGSNLLPIDYRPDGLSSPVFSYPYSRTREALETMRRTQQWDPCHGLKMRYVNPTNGTDILPTIAAFVQLLPARMTTQTYRSTESSVYVVVEGSGQTQVGDQTFQWGPKDIFVVPSWYPHHHSVSGDAVLFSVSDRGVQQKLGLWREARDSQAA
jgi:gentisate 1,2-dioxygenase